jgi:hypothetical protein
MNLAMNLIDRILKTDMVDVPNGQVPRFMAPRGGYSRKPERRALDPSTGTAKHPAR